MKIFSLYSGLLPIICFLLFYKKNKGSKLWVIFIYAVISFLSDRVLLFLLKTKEYQIIKYSIYCLFTVLEYSLFTYYIYVLIRKQFFKYTIIFLSIILYLIAIYNYYANVGKIGWFDSFTSSLESIFIILYCIFYLFEEINSPSTTLIYESYKFWLILSFLLYLSGELFLFIYAANFGENEIRIYWNINYSVNILKNILFCVAMIMKKDTPTRPSIRKTYNI